jgi:hypothetical protein
MYASERAIANDLAVQDTSKQKLELSSATSGHSCQTQPYNSISCRTVRFQLKRPVIFIRAELNDH